MFAECSLWRGLARLGGKGGGKRDLTVLALPDEVGFASATAHFVHFLVGGQMVGLPSGVDVDVAVRSVSW